MSLRLLQPRKAVYGFKNCKNYCDDSFSKEKGGQKGFPMYQNLSIITSSYVPRKNKFLQSTMPLWSFLGHFKDERSRNERSFTKRGVRMN